MADEANRHVDSASDDRTANNTVRHQYRVLTDAEKAAMVAIKDAGEELIRLCGVTVAQRSPREAALAKTKIEEAVMWAVKGLTA